MTRYWYFISNRETQQCIDLVADSPEAACRDVGWQQADCVVITVGEMHDVDAEPPPEAPLLTPQLGTRRPLG